MKNTVIKLLVILSVIQCFSYNVKLLAEELSGRRIGLEIFQSDYLGITGVVPVGWEESFPGTFYRFENEKDFTIIVQRSFPNIDIDQLLETTILNGYGPLKELPDPSGTIRTKHFQWTLYKIAEKFENVDILIDFALAQTEAKSYIVALVASPDNYQSYHDDLFLPVVERLTTSNYFESDSILKHNISLFDYDKNLPLDIQEMEETVLPVDGVVERDITYASPMGGLVPATLLLPKGKGPFPGLVVMHGYPSNRHKSMRSLALKYAQRGVAAILIDAPWARPDRSHRDDPLTFTKIDREEQIQLIIDLQRAVDILVQNPDIDNDQLAFVGRSYGAAMGGLFAGVEKRLKAYALIVGDGGLVNHFFGLEDIIDPSVWSTPDAIRWSESMWAIEPIHYIGNASPAALLFQNSRNDLAVPVTDAIRFQLAGSEPKTIIWSNSGHGHTDQMINDQMNWLRSYITIQN